MNNKLLHSRKTRIERPEMSSVRSLRGSSKPVSVQDYKNLMKKVEGPLFDQIDSIMKKETDYDFIEVEYVAGHDYKIKKYYSEITRIIKTSVPIFVEIIIKKYGDKSLKLQNYDMRTVIDNIWTNLYFYGKKEKHVYNSIMHTIKLLKNALQEYNSK